MPHQCTNCGRAFDDGSKEMLSGCPGCGGNKFQFRPSGESAADQPEPAAEPPEPPAPDSAVARTVGNAAATVRDLVGSGSSGPETQPAGPPDDDELGAAPGSSVPRSTTEDAAQADARSEVVSPDEIPAATADGWSPTDDGGPAEKVHGRTASAAPDPEDGQVVDSPTDDRPDLEDLRAELNDQFESIKVLSPGQYELNLMELYDREEYIIALQEDGRYTIQVPETWHE